MSISNDYLKKLQDDKSAVKIFLTNSTMLSGLITGFDESAIIIDKCFVNRSHLISIALQSK